jgi:hypothetical protein
MDERHRWRDNTRTVFARWYVLAFGIAAAIGLVCGVIAVAAGLWHFHVRPLW